jgi:hypothetical protein
MTKEALELTQLSLSDFLIRRDQERFSQFQEHLESLGVVPKGDILIIGPGLNLEEVGVLESHPQFDQTTSITWAGPSNLVLNFVLENFQKKHCFIPLKGAPSWGHYFDLHPEAKFDTIIQVGTCRIRFEAIQEFSSHLHPQGKLYISGDYLDRKFSKGQLPPGYSLEILPLSPTPTYGSYQGVIVEKL